MFLIKGVAKDSGVNELVALYCYEVREHHLLLYRVYFYFSCYLVLPMDREIGYITFHPPLPYPPSSSPSPFPSTFPSSPPPPSHYLAPVKTIHRKGENENWAVIYG